MLILFDESFGTEQRARAVRSVTLHFITHDSSLIVKAYDRKS
jgi:hypothetical protein